MRNAGWALLVAGVLTGCAKKPGVVPSSVENPTPSPQPKRVLGDLTEKERFEVLEQAMRDYHVAMESPKREDQINGFKSLVPEKKDFEKAFTKNADKVFDMSEQEFYKPALDNIDKVAKQETEFGALVKISIEDLRKKDRMSQSIKDDFAIVAPGVLVVQIHRHFERGVMGGMCLMWVEGRWVIIPEFGDIRKSLELWRKQK